MNKVPLQRVDCIADGRRGAPQAFGRASKASRFGYRQQHQKLIDARYRRAAHFEFLEKGFQFYVDFVGLREVVAFQELGCLRSNGNIVMTKPLRRSPPDTTSTIH
jgi:hypothetical protein